MRGVTLRRGVCKGQDREVRACVHAVGEHTYLDQHHTRVRAGLGNLARRRIGQECRRLVSKVLDDPARSGMQSVWTQSNNVLSKIWILLILDSSQLLRIPSTR